MKKNYNDVLNAIEFIEENLCEPISVQNICQLSELSMWQFQRVFRAYVGDSIGNYLKGRRLTSAAQILQQSQTSLSILDIAIQFQYNSQEAFSSALKKKFGLTPAEIRSKPFLRLPNAKMRLDNLSLNHIKNGINKEPSFVRIKTKSFVGLPITIKSPLGIESEFNNIIANHWDNFNKRRREISTRVTGHSYGFAFANQNDLTRETLTYLAAVEVFKQSNIPADMQSFHLDEDKLYAKFEVSGTLESCYTTMDYIYGIWLPQSNYIRGEGSDFEYFCHKTYNPGHANSISYYYLPVISTQSTNDQI